MNTLKNLTLNDIHPHGGVVGRQHYTALRVARRVNTLHGVGWWLAQKYRAAAAKRGYFVAATQLRKQGIPLNMALFILLGRTTP